MNHKSILFGCLAVAIVSACATAQKESAMASVEVGKAAPAFALTDSNGKSHKLADFAGKYVVLEWTNHQCPFVVRHYDSGNIPAQQKWAKENGVVWLSIVSSAPGKQGYVTGAEANQVMKEKKFSAAAMLLDPDGKVGRLYGAKTTPHMYVIDPKGQLIYMGGIDDDPRGSGEKRDLVILALKEAMAGKPVTTKTSQPYGCSVKF